MANRKIEIDLGEVERLASIGLSQQQVADSLGISEDTITRRKQDDADFAAALKRGKSKGIATVANNLFTQSADGNVSAGIFFMKNRAGWSDKQELTGKDGTPLYIPQIKRFDGSEEPDD